MNHEPLKVLVIDDEEPIHRALELTLRREPYELLHAYDAAEGMHLLAKDPQIRGVICDQNMPGTTGLDLLVSLRLRRPDVATMILTGEADLALASRAVNEAGVRGFLAKPWDGPQLRALLREMLDPDAAPPSPRREAVEAVERTLREELEPERDPETGAFIIDDTNT